MQTLVERQLADGRVLVRSVDVSSDGSLLLAGKLDGALDGKSSYGGSDGFVVKLEPEP